MPKLITALFASAIVCAGAFAAPAMVVVDEKAIAKDEPPPHGGIGMSTVYPISAFAPGRTMEFRKRSLHKGAALGLHPIAHDEVYYVVSGTGEVTSDGVTRTLTVGMTAYLYSGANVGIVQKGDEPLTLIIAYPLSKPAQ
jgi:mannose-6-phosphate isomerase-like protein (cupin superfamily)